MAKARITDKQRVALRAAHEMGRVSQEHGDGVDMHRPETFPARTLESLRVRGLLDAVEGPRYMPTYTITNAGREAIGVEPERDSSADYGLPAGTIAEPAPARTVVVEFTRIGRRRGVDPLKVEVSAGQSITEAVLPAVGRYARRFLASSGFDVTMDRFETGGAIEYGRFGQFTITQEA